MQTGQTFTFGLTSPLPFGHEQNIFDPVFNSQWISSPIVGLYWSLDIILFDIYCFKTGKLWNMQKIRRQGKRLSTRPDLTISNLYFSIGISPPWVRTPGGDRRKSRSIEGRPEDASSPA